MKKVFISIISIALLSTSLQAQQGWTLRQCIEYAIENNLTIKRAEVAISQSEVETNTSKWARLPNLSASAGQGFDWGNVLSPNDNTYKTMNSTSTSFSLSTNVPLFTGMQIPNQYKLSQLNLKAAIEDLHKAKDDLAINVASEYVKVLYNLDLAKIAREQVLLSKSQLDRILKLQEVGKASIAEVAEIRAQLAENDMSAVQAENNYQLSLLNLTQLLELPTPEGFSVAEPKVDDNFAPLTPPDEIYLDAVNNKPGIMAASYRLDGTERSIRIAQSAYYPQLSFGAGISSRYYTVEGKAETGFFKQLDENRQTYLAFNLSIPIFNRFATRNRVRSARLQQTTYAIQLDEAKKDLYKEIQQSWYNAVAAESQFTSSGIAVSASEEAFRLMTEKYENGKATFIEYNESRLKLMKSLSDQVQAKYEFMFRSKVLDFYKGIPIN